MNARRNPIVGRAFRATRLGASGLAWILPLGAPASSGMPQAAGGQASPTPTPGSGGQAETAKPEAGELLKRVGESYRAATTLRGDAIVQMEDPASPRRVEVPISFSFDAQHRMRVEWKGDMAMVMVTDGHTVWLYWTPLKQYIKIPLGRAEALGIQELAKLGENDYLDQLSQVAENVKQAEVVGAETLRVNEADTQCWVVSVDYNSAISQKPSPTAGAVQVLRPSGTKRLGVDKTRYLVYRESWGFVYPTLGAGAASGPKSTLTFTRLTVNEPIPDSTFVFQPPEGATEMDPSSLMPQTPPPN